MSDKLNPNLKDLETDHLYALLLLTSSPNSDQLCDARYHIGFSTADDLEALFGDVRFVVMGGSQSRMKGFAGMLADR